MQTQEPKNADFFNSRGLTFHELKEWEIAISDYTEAIKLNPENAVYFNNRRNTFHAIKEWDKAISDFIEAVKQDHQNAAYKNMLSAAKSEAGKNANIPATGSTETNRPIPNDSDAYISRGNALQEKGDINGAIADYNEAIRLNPNDARFYSNRGLAYLFKSDERAVTDFETALKLDPGNAKRQENFTRAKNAFAQSKASGKDTTIKEVAIEIAKDIGKEIIIGLIKSYIPI
ncbi:MAG: tetratricopeptide repeat protein [Treponema sp.]|jgi:tetratricopeptide (TPR) repeat protein|nr:tetratricopeptide repeat protein [Treponema sp.]